MRKKIYVIGIVITLVLLCGCTNSILLKINWEISMPEPNEVEVIHHFDYKEGDDIEIWKYDSSKVDIIKDKKEFKLINDSNLGEIKSYLNQYYEGLSYNEELQEKFNDNVSIEDIASEGNYYSLINYR